jgi:hypothetical protein
MPVQNSILTFQKTHCVFITKISWLVLSRKITFLYSENHIKPINTFYGQSDRAFILKEATPVVLHCDLNG